MIFFKEGKKYIQRIGDLSKYTCSETILEKYVIKMLALPYANRCIPISYCRVF